MGKKKASRSTASRILIGSAADLGLMFLLSAAAAAMVLGGAIGQGSIRTAALAANAIAVFGGSLIAAKGFNRQKLLMTLASAGGYLLVLLLGDLLFIGAVPAGAGAVALPALGAALAAAVLASRKPKGRRKL